MKVLLLNNYSMRSALRRVEAGNYPPQHLYGHGRASTQQRRSEWLRPGRSMYDIVRGHGRLWRGVRAAVLRSIGDPVQELRALLGSRPDVVFAADQWSAGALLLLKRLRLLSTPVLVLVHHPPASWWQRTLLGAADRRVVLGPTTADALERQYGARPRQLHWGADPSAAVYVRATAAKADPLDFVAAGRTNRDYRALIDLATRDGLRGVLFDGAARWDFQDGSVTKTARVVEYDEVLAAMARARCVVIPLRDPSVMSGLTEVADAAALGKAVVATRSTASPYDLEGCSSGISIEENSVAALRDAIQRASTLTGTGLLDAFSLARFEQELDEELEATLRTVAW